MELKGTITKIGDIQTFASGFQKREVVLTTQEQYPQPIEIEFLQDKIDLPDAHKVGDLVTIGINLRGREWVSPQGEKKYFNSITGWKILKEQSTPKPEPSKKTPEPILSGEQANIFNDSQNPFLNDDEDDDLPF